MEANDESSPHGPSLAEVWRVLGSASVYDVVLACVPLAFAAGALLGATDAVSSTMGVLSGSAGALAATAYALFAQPPV